MSGDTLGLIFSKLSKRNLKLSKEGAKDIYGINICGGGG